MQSLNKYISAYQTVELNPDFKLYPMVPNMKPISGHLDLIDIEPPKPIHQTPLTLTPINETILKFKRKNSTQSSFVHSKKDLLAFVEASKQWQVPDQVACDMVPSTNSLLMAWPSELESLISCLLYTSPSPRD